MPASEKRYRILVIDDDGRNHQVFTGAMSRPVEDGRMRELEAELFGETSKPSASSDEEISIEIDYAFQGEEGHAMVRREIEAHGRSPYAAVFVDMRMPPGWDGMVTMEQLWQLDESLQLVMCSAYADYSRQEIAVRLGRPGQFYTLQKPFQLADLRGLVRELAERWDRSNTPESMAH